MLRVFCFVFSASCKCCDLLRRFAFDLFKGKPIKKNTVNLNKCRSFSGNIPIVLCVCLCVMNVIISVCVCVCFSGKTAAGSTTFTLPRIGLTWMSSHFFTDSYEVQSALSFRDLVSCLLKPFLMEKKKKLPAH